MKAAEQGQSLRAWVLDAMSMKLDSIPLKMETVERQKTAKTSGLNSTSNPVGSEAVGNSKPAAMRPEKAPDPKPIRKGKKVCRHDVEQGFNCWQCGGLAKVGKDD
jgi:hypothetical protein